MAAMNGQRWLRASHHLDRALDLPPLERAACLATLRVLEPETAEDVEALLEEHRVLSAEGFLNARAPLPSSGGIPSPDGVLAGVTVGAYTLVSRIGHGGMGSVWLASRSDGRFEGQAALKLLNAALVGRGGEERFRREGTILARLTHPHIARLIDAGVSATGQPYLVLEHIQGRHIDRYCDEERLDVDARIRLFLDVQAAVAHAHANLIVHRDLKPSNVLVTTGGGVKLLDFGIAKLLEDEETGVGATALTREAGPALTPKYAAPEQVTGAPITTATDVYSLGVLLFELLSGVHPTAGGARSAAEFYHAVVETEPLRLSAAPMTASAATRDEVAARRGTTADRLPRLLRGDLETILGKALKRDPAERYASVTEFADDLRRFVEHQPITARRETVGYRAAKFVRRHRRSVAAVAAATVMLVGLIGFYTLQVTRERDRATRVSELLTAILMSPDPFRDGAKEPTVENLLDRGAERITKDLAGDPEIQAELFNAIGRTYERMGLYAKALPVLQQALAIGRRTLGPADERLAQSLNNLGVLNRQIGDLEAAEPLLREAIDMRRRVLGSAHKDVAVTLVELARVLQDLGRPEEAEAPIREALAIRRSLFGELHRETATSKNQLGLLLLRRGEVDAAEQLFRDGVETNLRLLGPNHPNTSASKMNLSLAVLASGRATEAEALAREALDVDRRVFGASHELYARTLNALAGAVEAQGRLAEAQAMYAESARVASQRLRASHPLLLNYRLNLARVRLALGDSAGTEVPLREIVAARQHLYPASDWRIAEAQSTLAASLLAQHRYAEAETLLLAASKHLKPVRGPQARERLATRTRLAALYLALNRPDLATQYRTSTEH